MKVIIPQAVNILTPPFAEDDTVDGAVWASSTTYSKGSLVRHEHIKYESLADSNTGNDPSTTWSGTEAKWKKIGHTSPYLMVDEFVETQTVGPESTTLTFSADFNRATAFALLNIEGYEVGVTVNDSTEGEFFKKTYGLVDDISDFSLYQYNYYPVEGTNNIIATDIPMPIIGDIQVTIEPGTGSVGKIGVFVVGRQEEIGDTTYGAEIGIIDYSRKETDDFGRTSLVKRSFSTPISLPIYVHPTRIDSVVRVLSSVRGMPCVWVGDNTDSGFSSLTVYGWLEDFRAVIEGPNEVQLSLEIQGLV